MRARFAFVLALAFLIAAATTGFAQQPGEIFGKATDASGGVLPGVTVTLSGGSLLQPLSATTSATGTYRFPGLAVGIYQVKFELTGFKGLLHDKIRVEIGANVQINGILEISSLQETVTVSGETPVVDLRDTSRTARLTQESLQSIPSARDPWVMIEQSPAVAMDRQNVGGSASGQQSNFVARGANIAQQKWNLDGVDITDMNATGGSPVYYDFDSFEEMQITTGGADVTMMTPGVGVNLVTKSGTDRLRGSSRYYITSDKVESNNVTDAMRKQGATSGNPVQNIKDYGLEVGGPIKKGKAWFWGSYAKQDINVGVNNFYKPDTACQTIKADLKKDPLSHSIEQTRGCLNSDQTLLNNYNAKVAYAPFTNNQFSFYLNAAEKVRNARDASDTRPIETTFRQQGVAADAGLGSRWWKTGMPKTYKWSDRQIFTDRFMVELQYAHVGNNFVLDFHEPSLADVQILYDNKTGNYANSFYAQYIVRPTDAIDLTGSYFMPGTLGGDHSFKFGFKYRNDEAYTATHYGGNAYAVTSNGVPSEAWIMRDGITDYNLHNRSFYVQDTFNRKKLTINAGFRFDYQSDFAKSATVAAVPFYGQKTLNGQVFDQLPSITFSGHDGGNPLKNWSPRVSLTYDLTGNSKNVVKVNYSRYVGQIGSGGLAQYYNPVKVGEVDYPWNDLNHDLIVQANEIVIPVGKTAANSYLYASSGYDPKNPTALTTTSTIDPNLKANTTNEFLVGFDRSLGPDMAVSASFIWRKYDNFIWQPRVGIDSSYYLEKTFTPPASGPGSCPAGARCPTVTYFQAQAQVPVQQLVTNQPDYSREYRGIEVSARKRMSKNWMFNTGFSFNDAPQYYKSNKAYQDPTNIANLDGAQYAEQSSNSGLDNVYVNTRWIYRLSGSYTMWKGINVAGFFNARGGYPWLPVVNVSRSIGGSVGVYLDKYGTLRLPTYKQIDFRLDKQFTFGRFRATAGVDIFNLLNENTVLSQRRGQNASNANQISSILAPRVARFGVRVTF